MSNNIFKFLRESDKTNSTIIEESGVTRSSFYAIANCNQIPRIDTALKISKALGQPVDKVFPELKQKRGECSEDR